jgi:threonylcarbamoyladenosine tRNA methylthiotransferase MtaB
MYTVRSFLEIIESFRNALPDFNFTTDVIVGFPGETEHDFQETVRVVKEARFSHIHTFRYSKRKGTRADRMEDQLAERIKAERSELIRQLSEKTRLQYLNSMIGKTQRVLIEKINRQGLAQGYGEHYLPVGFPTALRSTNQFRNIQLEDIAHGHPPMILGTDQSNNP